MGLSVGVTYHLPPPHTHTTASAVSHTPAQDGNPTALWPPIPVTRAPKTKTALVQEHLLCVQSRAGPVKTGILATSVLFFTCCELWGPAPGSRSEMGSSPCLPMLSAASKFITNVRTVLSPTGEGWNQRPSPSPVESKEEMSLAEMCQAPAERGTAKEGVEDRLAGLKGGSEGGTV